MVNDGATNKDYNAELHNICTLNHYGDGKKGDNGLIENKIGAEALLNARV
ncbi:hypothetical protein [Prochlorococcus marinus]|nr:hypothetical protein [Prochlorococcus marinus]